MTMITNPNNMTHKDPNWEDKLEVIQLQETIKEFTEYHKKHIFDEDTTIAQNYEEIIDGLKLRIKELESKWKR